MSVKIHKVIYRSVCRLVAMSPADPRPPPSLLCVMPSRRGPALRLVSAYGGFNCLLRAVSSPSSIITVTDQPEEPQEDAERDVLEPRRG